MTGNRSVGRAKSCVVCRQFKLACDARKTAPEPCTRCVTKNLTCRFDPNFRRISTRKIALEVTDEIHTLRAAQSSETTVRPNGALHPQIIVGGLSPPTSQENARASVSSNSSTHDQQTPEPPLFSFFELATDELVLDQTFRGVHINSDRILKLFYHFQRYYHPHTRFIPKITSINQLAAKSPLLFWTILVVASERYEGGSDGLYEQLCSIHAILMADVGQKSIQQLEVVHALLLLCLWPIPRLRNAYDPSWNYVALAISAASSLDCHSPLGKDMATSNFRGLADTTAAEMDPANQAMTWIACFEIGIRLGTYLGLPPPLCTPQQTRTIRRSQELAADILTLVDRASTRIHDVLCCASTHLDALDDPASQFSMLQVFEAQLDAIQTQFKECWGDSLQGYLLTAKIYILGFPLTLDAPSDEETLTQTYLYRQISLEKGMKASSEFISIMVKLSNQSIPGHRYPSGVLTFYPKHHFASVVAAAAFLFRYLVSYQGASATQQTHAISNIAEAHKIMQSFPDHRDAVRACINIETFVNAIRNNNGTTTNELLVKNRLGASVLYDAVFQAARYRNRHKVDASGEPITRWFTMEEDVNHVHRLPLAPEQKVASPDSRLWPDTYASSVPFQVEDTASWAVWDNHFNQFGVLNEPWVQYDDEFALAGLQAQNMFSQMPASYDNLQPMDPTMGS